MNTRETAAPRIVQGRPMCIAGIRARYAYTDCRGIPAQWARFREAAGKIKGAVGDVAYGVCCATETESELHYYAGIEVMAPDHLPAGLVTVNIPENHYAVFASTDHISTIQHFIQQVWTTWLREFDCKVVAGPSLEKYGPDFDPETGEGGFEIWIPVLPPHLADK